MFSCFLIRLRSLCVPQNKVSQVGAGVLETNRAKCFNLQVQLLTENHFPFWATCCLPGCAPVEAGGSGLAAGCSCILFAALFSFCKNSSLYFILVFTLWGSSIKSLLRKHNDFHCVLHACPAAPKCQHSMFFSNYLIISIFILWFYSSCHSVFSSQG